METLQQLRTLINYNNVSAHREANIDFLTYISIGLTLQSSAKIIVVDALIKVDLHPNTVKVLRTQCENGMITTNESTNKRDTNGNRKDPKIDTQKLIVFPAFDISIKKVGFGNGLNRVTTISNEIKYQPTHVSLLNFFQTKAYISDLLPTSHSKSIYRYHYSS